MPNTNTKLKQAKKAKKDEFYTLYETIEKELKHYTHHFEDKIVYCNCDDPHYSNFIKYFKDNFNNLKLKKLVSTCYRNYSDDLLGDTIMERGLKYEYDGQHSRLTLLKGDGDFRSKECIKILEESDIVVTNPPFSLFREYFDQLVKYNKTFVIIGNILAMNYKGVFNSILKRESWIGTDKIANTSPFMVPSNYIATGNNHRFDEKGNKFFNVATTWFTNLHHGVIKPYLELTKEYNPKDYPELDNYKAINVNRITNIPYDYYDVMAVPVTFSLKWNKDQFEILGITRSWFNNGEIFKNNMTSNDPILNGKTLFGRLLIRRIK